MPPSIDFHLLFELAPNAYALLDRQLRVVAANQSLLRSTGLRAEHLLGRYLLDAFPFDSTASGAESARRVTASVGSVLATGRSSVLPILPFRLNWAGSQDARERFWSVTSTPIPDESGQVVFVLVHAVEVTDQGALSGEAAHRQSDVGVLNRLRHAEELTAFLEAERNHLRQLFDQAPGFVAVFLGPELALELANAACRRLFGGEGLVGRRARELLGGGTSPEILRVIEEVHSSGRAQGRRVRLHLPGTGAFPPEDVVIDFDCHPVVSESGVTQGVFLQGRDATEEERLAAERETAVGELRFLAEMIPQQVWTATPDGQVDFVNRRFSDYFGGGPDAVLGFGWRAIPHPDDLERVSRRWQHSLETGDPYEVEARLQRPDGTFRWFLGRALPFRDEAGRIVRWFGTNTDIHGARASADELRARAEFEQQLIGIVSHDLKSPLTAVSMSAKLLLRRGQLDERQAPVVSRIASSADRALRLIADFLDFTRTRFAGRLPISPSETELPALVQEVVDEMLLGSPDRNVIVRHEGETVGRWDPDRLAQAVGNLVGNAFQHSPVEALVTVTSRVDAQWAEVRVNNEGPALERGELEKLFEPYRRGDPSKPGGLGLGLYITRAIVTAHGGEVVAESSVEAGTTFTLRLPRFVEGTQGG